MPPKVKFRYPEQRITVRRRPKGQYHSRAMGIASFACRQVFCAIGRAGTTPNKREGDGKSPIGRFRVLEIYYRTDRMVRPRVQLPLTPIRQNFGWCDDPQDRNYNRRVVLPYPASHERLWRDDHLYDIVIVLDQNTRHRMRNRGSAIFLHLAHRDYRGTEGCVALKRQHMRQLISWLKPGAIVKICY